MWRFQERVSSAHGAAKSCGADSLGPKRTTEGEYLAWYSTLRIQLKSNSLKALDSATWTKHSFVSWQCFKNFVNDFK